MNELDFLKFLIEGIVKNKDAIEIERTEDEF
jgi:predicted RNA-binding protein YlqC (UPF0109 family)